MLNLHKCEGDRSVNLFFVLPSSAFWLPGHTIVQFFSMTARPRAAMAWLFGEWRAGSSVLEFSEGLRELPTQMHSCRKRKAKSKCSTERRPQTPTYIHTPTSRITTRELAGWLAGGITTREPVLRFAGWLAGGLAGWLRPREAQRGPERPREAQRGPEMRSVDRTSLSCGNP